MIKNVLLIKDNNSTFFISEDGLKGDFYTEFLPLLAKPHTIDYCFKIINIDEFWENPSVPEIVIKFAITMAIEAYAYDYDSLEFNSVWHYADLF